MSIYKIEPDSSFRLKDHDPGDKRFFPDIKDRGVEAFHRLKETFIELQNLLYAENKHRILIVFQAMDTGGKDGTIRHIFSEVSPLGVQAVSFKKPTEKELSHDFLWRIHHHTPGKGQMVLFNRSHYEDIVAVRVNKLAPKEIWEKRYEHILNFEKMLVDEGVTILKFFLNISQKEQKVRLKARLNRPEKHWKFNPADLDSRNLWSKYMSAYEDVISKTSKGWAPWFVIPANRKWYRNLVVTSIIIDTLKGLNMRYPKATFDPKAIKIE